MMKMLKWNIMLLAVLLISSCQEKKPAEQQQAGVKITESSQALEPSQPKKGDRVPNHLVCMVNDAYMGKQQLEVPFDGKMYYGCCEMCRKRIPEDETVRLAKDPLTLKNIDKAQAYIVLIGDNGEVAYFENENNYIKFKKQSGTVNLTVK